MILNGIKGISGKNKAYYIKKLAIGDEYDNNLFEFPYQFVLNYSHLLRTENK